MHKRTVTELLELVKDYVREEGIPPSTEYLAHAIHVKAKSLTAIGSTSEILELCGYGVSPLPPSASQFERAVYPILCGVFGEDNIEYQHIFPDCRNEKALPFDFYIKNINLIVEADGNQHYDTVYGYFNNHKTRGTDPIKNEYCKAHGIALLRIRYRRYTWHTLDLIKVLREIQLHAQETGHANCFNCWDGSSLIPISSQDPIKHKPKRIVNITRPDEKTVYYEVSRGTDDNVHVILDAEFFDKHMGNSTIYIRKGKLIWSKTGTLLANAVLEHKGHGKWITKYRNGDVCDLRKKNLYLIENKEQARPKRGAYKTSKTGIPGVNLCKAFVKGKYYYTAIATHRITGKKKNFPVIRYGSPEAALEAAKAWAWEGSTTIPEGSTPKPVEMGSTQTGKAVGDDIV